MIPVSIKQACEPARESQLRSTAQGPASPTPSILACPYCSYNLCGQIEPRCPECGYRYAWEDLHNPQRRIHPFLYEHHPERGFMSFWKSMFASWRPRAFWGQVSRLHTLNIGRLVRYLAFTCAISVLIATANAALEVVTWGRRYQQNRQTGLQYWKAVAEGRVSDSRALKVWTSLGPSVLLEDGLYPPLSLLEILRKSEVGIQLERTLLLLSWPLLTFVSMLIFHGARRRARASPLQILRVVVYTSDVSIWLTAWVVVTGLFSLYAYQSEVALVLLMILAMFRLACALKMYLCFEHPFIVAATSQVFVMLAWICILLA